MPDTITHGTVGYRSKLMREVDAFRFARCLEANEERCAEVYVHHAPHAKGERAWFVSWAPATDEAKATQLARILATQVERAVKEGRGYLWDADETGRFWRVQSLRGQVYEVGSDGRSCTCPQFETRMKALGLKCKHLISFDLKLGRRTDGRLLDPSVLDLGD